MLLLFEILKLNTIFASAIYKTLVCITNAGPIAQLVRAPDS